MPTASCKWPRAICARTEEHTIEVQPSYGLSDTEIERMLEESIEYAEQDFAERQVIEARNEARRFSPRRIRRWPTRDRRRFQLQNEKPLRNRKRNCARRSREAITN